MEVIHSCGLLSARLSTQKEDATFLATTMCMQMSIFRLALQVGSCHALDSALPSLVHKLVPASCHTISGSQPSSIIM